MACFIRLDQSHQHVQSVAFRSIGLSRHKPLDFGEFASIVGVGLDWKNINDRSSEGLRVDRVVQGMRANEANVYDLVRIVEQDKELRSEEQTDEHKTLMNK